jgi:6-phospho-3-hexuloisomerase
MPIAQFTTTILSELKQTLSAIKADNVDQLTDQILKAESIFVAGAGRSGLMMRAFAMRMMQMGLQAYVVGETVTPGIKAGDLLIIGSGSGETKSLVSMAAKAQSIGAAIAAVTIVSDSTISRMANIVIQVPAATKDSVKGGATTIQPMGSLYEQSLLLLFDTIVLSLMRRQEFECSDMFGRHANLE